MTSQQLAEQTSENIALTIGRTTMKMVEAQTAADLLMQESEQAKGLLTGRQPVCDLFVGLLALLWLTGAF